MPLITRTDKGSRLTIQEMDGNLTYLENAALDTFTLSAHTTLTSDDVGKFIMSWTDTDYYQYLINGGTLSEYSGSRNQARVAFLSGTSSGQNGKWTIDFTQTYNSYTWDNLSQNDTFIQTTSNTNTPIFNKLNFNFQESDPFLSSIISSLTYSSTNDGHGTYSYTDDYESIAILFDYYCNNGFPVEGSTTNNNYAADGRYGASEPYYITQTFSAPFVGSVRTGTSVQFEIDNTDIDYIDIIFFSSFGTSTEPDVNLIKTNLDYPFLQNPVVGILKSLSDEVATLSKLPEVIRLAPTTGTFLGTESNYITSFPIDNTFAELSITSQNWYVSGGDDLVNSVKYFSADDQILVAMIVNSPTYRVITSGAVGETMTFIKVNPFTK